MPWSDAEIKTVKNRYKIVGNDPALNHAIETALSIAWTDLPVLIIGESGVGKEVFSRIIHDFSKRKNKKFLAINCGAIPSGTVNSELFGHEKGAFTGAVEPRKGYFEEADGGTIFLDEIGDLPRDTQAQLLRVLQQGEFLRVGSSKIQKTNVRVIAATNMNLQHAISRDRFRVDLFYRLNSITIQIPPLRERPEDIPLLFKQFCADFATENNFCLLSLTRDAEEALKRYRWPGNIRELMGVTGRICAMESHPISQDDKDERIVVPSSRLDKYLPHDEGAYIPVVAENSEGSLNPGDREMIIRSILTLKQEVDALKKTVSTLQGAQPAGQPLLAGGEESELMDGSDIRIGRQSPQRGEYEPEDQVQPAAAEECSDFAGSVAPVTLEDRTYQDIIASMARNNNNRSKVAKELGISERTVYRKLDKMAELGLWEKE